MGEESTGNVSGTILLLAPALRLREVVADVDDDPGGVRDVRGEFGCTDKRGVHGRDQSLATCGGPFSSSGCSWTAMIPAATMSTIPIQASSGSTSPNTAIPSALENTMPL